jgi:hypothetical protein
MNRFFTSNQNRVKWGKYENINAGIKFYEFEYRSIRAAVGVTP